MSEEASAESVVEEVVTPEVTEEVVESKGTFNFYESAESVEEPASEEVSVEASTEEELVEELEKAEEEGATKEELTNMVREFTLKVNGKDYIKSIDLSDEEAVRGELQKALAGQQAMQSRADLQKLYDGDKQRLMDNPFAVLEELGLDPTALSADHIEKFLERKAMSPEAIEQERVQREFEEMKAENERMKKEFEEKERSTQMAAAEKEIESDIIGALDGDTDLEASPEVINMVVDNMLWAMKNGFQDVTAKDVIPTVKAEIQKKYRSYASSMKSPTALKALLGDDILNGLRDERLEKVKKQVSTVNNIKSTAQKPSEDKVPKKKKSLSDFMNGR